jgi:CheY-like chemotaxis protein
MDGQRVILVVDDDASVLRSTSRLLVARGFTAIEATNATEALTKAIAVSPDAILMDLQMEHTNGVDAARQLKAVDSLKNIPIIAVSATPPEQETSLAFFARILLKPCPSADIVDAIEAVLQQP